MSGAPTLAALGSAEGYRCARPVFAVMRTFSLLLVSHMHWGCIAVQSRAGQNCHLSIHAVRIPNHCSLLFWCAGHLRAEHKGHLETLLCPHHTLLSLC